MKAHRFCTSCGTLSTPSGTSFWWPLVVLVAICVGGLTGCDLGSKEVAEEGAAVGASNSSDLPVVVVFDAEGVPVLNSFVNWKKPMLILPGANGGETLELMDPHDTTMWANIYKAPSAQFGHSSSRADAWGQVLQVSCDDNTCSFEWIKHGSEAPSEKSESLNGTLIKARNTSSEDRYLSFHVQQTREDGVPLDNSIKENHVNLPSGDEVTLAIDSSADSILKLNIAVVEYADQVRFPVKLIPFDKHSISVGVLPGNEYSVAQSFTQQRVVMNPRLKDLEDEKIVE